MAMPTRSSSASRAPSSTDERVGQGRPRRARQPVDLVLEPGHRPGPLDDVAQLVDLGGVEVGAPQQGLDPRPAGGVGARQGVGEQHGALALAQVVAGRLAGLLGVAEHPEQVVAQLEGPAQVEAVARQRRQPRGVERRRWWRR